MGGRGKTSSSGAVAMAGATGSVTGILATERTRLTEIYDLLHDDERAAVIGLTAKELATIGLDPRLAFILTAQNLGDDQIQQLIDRANNVKPSDYVVLSPAGTRGGALYPFLEQTQREWRMIMRPIDEAIADADDLHPLLPAVASEHNFGMETPTLRWVKDGKIVDVYVDGMSLDDFTKSLGLQITMPKGEAVTGKRLSRLFREYKVFDFFPSSDLDIRVLEQSDEQKTVWDGAGVISRRLIQDLAVAQGITGPRLQQLLREIDQGGRVEFTILNEQGQYKGHAIVSEQLKADFLLPDDVKTDVRLTGGNTFIGINFVHGNERMNIDVQSLTNLYPFFDGKSLAEAVATEGNLFLADLASGYTAASLQRIQPNATVDDLERWALLEYYARGGDPMWFRTPITTLMSQHTNKLDASIHHKLRLPIAGQRYYIMPDAVGRAAGRNVTVPPGGIQIDPDSATAWVNAADWIALQDSPNQSGIRDLLGGADHDDSLWLHPFRDAADGEIKILTWRSPNEPGDYVLLKPTPTSSIALGIGDLDMHDASSALLPTRRDRQSRTYMGLVPDTDGSSLGKGQPYSIDIMDLAIRQEARNAGTLGMYVNTLMVHQLVSGQLPDKLPAPLEQIVDASAKTGADLRAVKGWIFDEGRKFSQQQTPVPDQFRRRVTVPPDEGLPRPPKSTGHWMDTLIGALSEHNDLMKGRTEQLLGQAQAPASLFEAVFQNPEDLYLGSEYNRAYAAALKRYQTQFGQGPKANTAAQLAAEAFLANFEQPKQRAILRGALVSTQMSEQVVSDNAAWLPGHRGPDGRAQSSIAHETMEALSEVGILGSLETVTRTDRTTGRESILAVATPPPPRAERRVELTTLESVTAYELLRTGHQPRKATKAEIRTAQSRIEAMTRKRDYDQLQLTVRTENINGQRRNVAYTPKGIAIGVLPPGDTHADGDIFTIKHAIRQGNNLRIILDTSNPA